MSGKRKGSAAKVVPPASQAEARAMIDALAEWVMTPARQSERDRRGGWLLGEMQLARREAWIRLHVQAGE